MSLEGLTAVVTGAAGGIGFATSRRLVALGARVLGVDLAESEGEERLATLGPAARFVAGDVTSSTDVGRLRAAAEGWLGTPDIVINNAGGIRGVYFDILETEEADWDRTLSLNTKAAYLVSRAFLPAMLARGSGSIVNIGSGAGLTGAGRQAAYSAAKGGVIALTRAMAIDYAARGVRVNCVCPGITDTPPIARMFRTYGNPDEVRASFLARIPMGRMARPDEIANVVAFVASPDASYMTGAIVTVDGGWTAQ